MQSVDRDMFDAITKDYEFRTTNYAVAYQFLQFLNKLKLCEHTDIYDDYSFKGNSVYSDWVIFFTCMPKDMMRMGFIAKRIPSSYPADIKILNQDEEVWFFV